MKLRFFNTMSRTKEDFIPIDKNEITYYSCGPTVYWTPHVGNLRAYVFTDILKRVLLYNKYKVKHCMNYTDVGHLTSDADTGEDKIEKAAKKENKTAIEISEHYTMEFNRDCKKLNIIPPTITCKATEYIQEQIELIEKLEKKGFTYKTDDGIYFDSSKFPDYGKLGRINIDELSPGKRTCMRGKKHKTDFALWKFSEKPGVRQQEWKSPWGTGFPGWHTECCAMSIKHLGEQFDIHTGGEDHIQVHHTNEIAQAETYTGKKPWVNYWMHNGYLTFKGEKVSKSKGGLYTLAELENKGYNPIDFRYLCLTAQYRKQLNFSFEAMDSAKNTLARLKHKILELKNNTDSNKTENYDKFKEEFLEGVNNDLNTPKALSVLWAMLDDKELGSLEKLELAFDFDKVLGLSLENVKEEKIEAPKDVLSLVKARQKAREEKDFAAADKARYELKEKGFAVDDTPDGPKLRKL